MDEMKINEKRVFIWLGSSVCISAMVQSPPLKTHPKVPKKVHKIKEERTLSSNCLQNEDSLDRIYKPIDLLKKQGIVIDILFFVLCESL